MFKNKVMILMSVLFCLAMVLFPKIAADASKAAISLWLNDVVPALFPFIIMANFIQSTGVIGKIPAGIYPLVMAFLSGYPMGAKVSADAYQSGSIDQNHLLQILSYSMITGPAFIISAVGIGFFHSQTSGLILALSHYAGALLNSAGYGGIMMKNRKRVEERRLEGKSLGPLLTDAMLNGFKTIGIILAYIMLFMIGMDLLGFLGAFSMAEQDYVRAFLKGLVEMTAGCAALADCRCAQIKKLVLASFLISFGGFSVIGQTMSMLDRCPVPLMEILKIKVRHGIISAILTFTLVSFVV